MADKKQITTQEIMDHARQFYADYFRLAKGVALGIIPLRDDPPPEDNECGPEQQFGDPEWGEDLDEE